MGEQIERRTTDALFEAFYLIETGRAYARGARITANERGKINRAAGQAREAGFDAAEVLQAASAWALRMPSGTRITALGVVSNLSALLNAAQGGVAFEAPDPVDQATRLAIAAAEAREGGIERGSSDG